MHFVLPYSISTLIISASQYTTPEEHSASANTLIMVTLWNIKEMQRVAFFTK